MDNQEIIAGELPSLWRGPISGGEEGDISGGDSGVDVSTGSDVSQGTSVATGDDTTPATDAAQAMPNAIDDERVPIADLRKLQSAKDQELARVQAESQQRIIEAMQLNAQLFDELDGLRMQGQPQEVIDARKAYRELQMEKTRMQMQQQALEPIAKQEFANRVAAHFKVPVEHIKDFSNPQDMVNGAKYISQLLQSQALQKRAKDGVDKVEGSGATMGRNKVKETNDPMELFRLGYGG